MSILLLFSLLITILLWLLGLLKTYRSLGNSLLFEFPYCDLLTGGFFVEILVLESFLYRRRDVYIIFDTRYIIEDFLLLLVTLWFEL